MLRRGAALWFVALHGDEQKRRCERIFRDHGYGLFTVEGAPIDGPLEREPADEICAVPPGR